MPGEKADERMGNTMTIRLTFNKLYQIIRIFHGHKNISSQYTLQTAHLKKMVMFYGWNPAGTSMGDNAFLSLYLTELISIFYWTIRCASDMLYI